MWTRIKATSTLYEYLDALDFAEAFPDETQHCAISAHGYDPDTTPVDTLMAGPLSMHLDYAEGFNEHS